MKKKIAIIILVLLLCCTMVMPALADKSDGFVNEYYRVLDIAELITMDERLELLDKLDEISIRQKMEVAVVTTDDLLGQDIIEYAESTYDMCKFGYGKKKDGVLLLVSSETYEWYILTNGYGTTAFTDGGLDYIGEQMEPLLTEGEYVAAFDVFAKLCDIFITQARTDTPYDVGNLPDVNAIAPSDDTSDNTSDKASDDNTEYPRVMDNADLLTDDEEAALLEKLDELSLRQKMDVVVATTEGLEGKTVVAYADDLYDNCHFGYEDTEDGLMLLISMEDRDWYITTCGAAIKVFTDAGIEYIGEQMLSELSDGDYAGAFNTFADQCDAFITQANTDKPYDYDNLPQPPLSPIWLVISIVVGFLIALGVVGSMKSKLKSVHLSTEADCYIVNGSLNITESRDMFLYRTVSKTEIPRDNSSSGGSSTHSSSSGSSHGGGGGKF